MSRGIFRIIAGIAMIILQLLMISFFWAEDFAMLSNVFFYSYGVVGVMLLIFGMRAYMTEYSQLILHTNHKGIHTVTKWIAFALCVILLAYYTVRLVVFWSAQNIFSVLMILSIFSFGTYSLFYMYKKPACLFSTTLLLMALFYLFDLGMDFSYLFYVENVIQYLLLSMLPRLITGILYIIIAVKLYKEDHSVKLIKILGWVVLALEFIARIPEAVAIIIEIPQRITWGGFFLFYDIGYLVEIGYVFILWVYLSVFKINTLREPMVVEMENKIKFCRKCGEKLIDSSNFCRKCGTEIIKEIEG